MRQKTEKIRTYSVANEHHILHCGKSLKTHFYIRISNYIILLKIHDLYLHISIFADFTLALCYCVIKLM